jgi:hypothetical protein
MTIAGLIPVIAVNSDSRAVLFGKPCSKTPSIRPFAVLTLDGTGTPDETAGSDETGDTDETDGPAGATGVCQATEDAHPDSRTLSATAARKFLTLPACPGLLSGRSRSN